MYSNPNPYTISLNPRPPRTRFQTFRRVELLIQSFAYIGRSKLPELLLVAQETERSPRWATDKECLVYRLTLKLLIIFIPVSFKNSIKKTERILCTVRELRIRHTCRQGCSINARQNFSNVRATPGARFYLHNKLFIRFDGVQAAIGHDFLD